MLKAMLPRFVDADARNWDTLLPYILFAYREAPQSSTGFSPNELVYGRQLRGPLDVMKEVWTDAQETEAMSFNTYWTCGIYSTIVKKRQMTI